MKCTRSSNNPAVHQGILSQKNEWWQGLLLQFLWINVLALDSRIIVLLYIDAEEHLMACFMAVPSVVHVKDNERK